MDKIILDACCGGRTFWFNKNAPGVIYQDVRTVEPLIVGKNKDARKFECKPDLISDFREMKEHLDSTFKLVVFDPPHLRTLGAKSFMAIKYGVLNKQTWKRDLADGFKEVFRVLMDDGILIFKWNEYEIRLSEILDLAPYHPLIGLPSGKMQKTHWVTFMKNEAYKR